MPSRQTSCDRVPTCLGIHGVLDAQLRIRLLRNFNTTRIKYQYVRAISTAAHRPALEPRISLFAGARLLASSDRYTAPMHMSFDCKLQEQGSAPLGHVGCNGHGSEETSHATQDAIADCRYEMLRLAAGLTPSSASQFMDLPSTDGGQGPAYSVSADKLAAHWPFLRVRCTQKHALRLLSTFDFSQTRCIRLQLLPSCHQLSDQPV